jgi:hypothetical protein
MDIAIPSKAPTQTYNGLAGVRDREKSSTRPLNFAKSPTGMPGIASRLQKMSIVV